MTGTHLSQQVYALLTYIQATQSQTLLEKSTITKNKSKEKKKALKGLNMPGKVSKNIFNTGFWVCFSRINLTDKFNPLYHTPGNVLSSIRRTGR